MYSLYDLEVDTKASYEANLQKNKCDVILNFEEVSRQIMDREDEIGKALVKSPSPT